MRVRLSILGVIVAALVLNAIPAGASISLKAARAQYLRDVAPTNAALFRLSTQAGKWSNQTSDVTAEKAAAPAITALRRLQNALLSQQWPAKASSDIRTLTRALSPIEADLLALSALTVLGTSEWGARYTSHVAALSLDVNYVRHDLGLPLRK